MLKVRVKKDSAMFKMGIIYTVDAVNHSKGGKCFYTIYGHRFDSRLFDVIGGANG
jgi:hypothetical protein